METGTAKPIINKRVKNKLAGARADAFKLYYRGWLERLIYSISKSLGFNTYSFIKPSYNLLLLKPPIQLFKTSFVHCRDYNWADMDKHT